MPARYSGKGEQNVYAAAEKWIDAALRKDDSLFTPGKAIWTRELLGELRTRYLDQPDVTGSDFYDKLRKQLEGSPPEVYQLMSEVLYAHFLIIWRTTMRGDTKLERIRRILGWSEQQIAVPEDLVEGLSPGIAAIGGGYGGLLPFMVGFLVEFVDQWKEQDLEKRQGLLVDPWKFKDFGAGIELKGALFQEGSNLHRLQREALLHLVFPDIFEGTVSIQQKEQIAGAKAFAHFVSEEIPDLDGKIQQIRKGIEAGLGRDFGFYDDDIHHWWNTSAPTPWWNSSTSNPWDTYLRFASDFLHSGKMWEDELKYKYEIGRKLAAVREAVLDGADDWADLVKDGVSGNIIHFTQQDNFRKWIDTSSNEARRALQALWTRDDSSVSERIRAFSDLFPRDVTSGEGTRMNVISQLLMGLDVEQSPPFRVTTFDNAYERNGYAPRPGDADEAALYEHALGFLDRLTLEARARGIPVRHRLDAQSLVWKVPYLEREERQSASQPQSIESPPQPTLQTLAEELFLTDPPDFLHEINTLLTDKQQVIFQGPPGTGKTYVAQQLAEHLARSEDRVTLVQFHPSYAYEDFVQGFRPKLSNGQAGFVLSDGPLLRAAERARKEPDANHYLIIDEINRGNLAKVFGELYYLLEYRDDEITLQYQADEDKKFSLPKNLYIIGTMNTADRSIALVDLALRRRFYFVEFHPDAEPVKGVLRRWLRAKQPDMEWVADVAERANEQLRDDRHAAIGPSYFMKDGLDDDMVDRVWKHSVLPYIEERRFGGEQVTEDFDLEKLTDEVMPRRDCIANGLSRLAGVSMEEAVRRIEAEGGTTHGEVSSRWQNWHAAYRASGLKRVAFQRGQNQTLSQIAETNQAFIARVRMHLVTVIDGELFEACRENIDMDSRAYHYWVKDDGDAETVE